MINYTEIASLSAPRTGKGRHLLVAYCMSQKSELNQIIYLSLCDRYKYYLPFVYYLRKGDSLHIELLFNLTVLTNSFINDSAENHTYLHR